MFRFFSNLTLPSHTPGVSDVSAHTEGTNKGEQWIARLGREPGRNRGDGARHARDSTSICPEDREPIDPRMPRIPPA